MKFAASQLQSSHTSVSNTHTSRSALATCDSNDSSFASALLSTIANEAIVYPKLMAIAVNPNPIAIPFVMLEVTAFRNPD